MSVWNGTKIKLPWMQEPLNEFIDIVWEIMESYPNVDWILFAVIAWSLWSNRNSVIHEGKSKGHEVLIRSVADFVEEIKQEKQPPVRLPTKTKFPWSPPRKDWYKINTDGAVFKEIGSCGSGGIRILSISL
ncbi:hypothetical protein SO802_034705 [Lithocarpus litseifolius]|uniref:Uncharacterized protein n=1 Tax=Lithocarpus litseifolius TaxID=425828 RepID=A0AAW2BJW1_9ROSI